MPLCDLMMCPFIPFHWKGDKVRITLVPFCYTELSENDVCLWCTIFVPGNLSLSFTFFAVILQSPCQQIQRVPQSVHVLPEPPTLCCQARRDSCLTEKATKGQHSRQDKSHVYAPVKHAQTSQSKPLFGSERWAAPWKDNHCCSGVVWRDLTCPCHGNLSMQQSSAHMAGWVILSALSPPSGEIQECLFTGIGIQSRELLSHCTTAQIQALWTNPAGKLGVMLNLHR